MTLTKEELQAKAAFDHAKGCKRNVDDCSHCKANVKWFARLPLQTLSHLLTKNNYPRRME